MKYKILLLLVLICVNSWLHSFTWHIKQDGTGNFTTIQEGIIAATDNDTILVYPGTYYENIDYLEKSLTVASLYIITPEDSLINQTIIDGNQQAHCVKIDECENASIIGFTIQNGYALQEGFADGYEGGGIFIEDTASSLISNCKIRNNKSYNGGGIYVNHTNIVLRGNTISNNRSIKYGGGLYIAGNDTVVQFDQIELNNLYLNYSATGADINMGGNVQNFINVIVDTFTVNNPDYFFITCSDSLYTFSNLNAKMEEIDQDLYVSPNGDDSNCGLTSDDPLQTLAWAQTIIKRNDENPNTIHLEEGTYSSSLNNQIFPLNVKHGVLYSGISPLETILDAENEFTFFFQFSKYQNEFAMLIIENLRMVNGVQLGNSFGGISIYQADINLTNVIIENCNGGVGSAILTANGYCNLNNVTIRNNTGGRGVSHSVEYNCPNPVLNATFINSIFQNNNPGEEYYSGGAIQFGGHSNITGIYNAQLINCEISENYCNFYNPQTDMGGTSGLYLKDMVLVDVVNTTFGDNTLSHNTGCTTSVYNTELNLYNSILYNNVGYSINLWEDALVNISHSLIEGGNDNVNYYYPLAIVNWLDGNLDEDPTFDSLGTNPFALLENSPCINTGTLDLPAGIELPEFDLAGNPRIYGDTIDMGAYEYQGNSIENYEMEITNYELSNYPNPFRTGSNRNSGTKVSFTLLDAGDVKLEVFNVKGQKVKTLMNAFSQPGKFELNWDGTDDNGKGIASGVYFAKAKVNGEVKIVHKMTVLK